MPSSWAPKKGLGWNWSEQRELEWEGPPHTLAKRNQGIPTGQATSWKTEHYAVVTVRIMSPQNAPVQPLESE